MTPREKAKDLMRRMMYNISGHSNLIKRNNAKKHIVILCDEIMSELKAVNAYDDISGIDDKRHITNGSFWEEVRNEINKI